MSEELDPRLRFNHATQWQRAEAGVGENLSLTRGDPQYPLLDNNVRFYVVDWLPPDFGAVGQYASIFARVAAQIGQKVVLIGLTSGPTRTSEEHFADGGWLETKWLHGSFYNKTGFVSRAIWSVCTNLRLMWEVVRDKRSIGAEVTFTGAPPFMLFFGIFAKWLRGARLIYRITDFYPEVLIAALGRRPVPLALLERVTWFLRRKVDEIEVLGEDQRRLLLANGIPPEQIRLKRDVEPVPISGREKPAPHPIELAGRMLLLYSGNYGAAHEIETVVEGLIRHHREGSGQFALWLNASGSNVDSVTERLQIAGIPFARTKPGPLDQLPALLAAADLHLVTLRPEFSGLVVPSKIYGCLRSGRPILFVGPKSSDVHLLCKQAQATIYEHVEPGDVTAFVAALERVAHAGRHGTSESNSSHQLSLPASY